MSSGKTDCHQVVPPLTPVYSLSHCTVVTWVSFWCCVFPAPLISCFSCASIAFIHPADLNHQGLIRATATSCRSPLVSTQPAPCPSSSTCHPTPFTIKPLNLLVPVSVSAFWAHILIKPLTGWVYNGDKVRLTQILKGWMRCWVMWQNALWMRPCWLFCV